MRRFFHSGAMKISKFLFLFLLPLCLAAPAMLSALSCDDADAEDVDDSGADDDTDDGDEKICGVTFNENIKPFMENYCARCHSAQVPSAERNGAPESSNFDTREDVLADWENIRNRLLDNSGMPPTPPDPTHIERDDVIAWIDCVVNQLGL